MSDREIDREIDHEKIEESEETVLTAKDPKKVAQGKWLASVSKKAKKDKLRKEIMEEEFSYLPYILYPLAGVSTFLLIVNFLTRKKEVVKYEYVPVTKEIPEANEEKIAKQKEAKPSKNNYETLG